MSATDTIRAFWNGRASVDGHVASRFHSEHDRYDLPSIGEYCAPGARILDLGCGTCSVANAIVENTASAVHAVDYVDAFLANAIDDPRLTTEAADVRSYRSDREFDLILLLGVITYIEDPATRAALYRNCAEMLPAGGALFIKAQFGVEDEVLVDTWSDALGARYRAIYPTIAGETALLDADFSVEVRDPYPAALSPHANTHFHHLVATRR
jgi:trans-aconitate methyltransferase